MMILFVIGIVMPTLLIGLTPALRLGSALARVRIEAVIDALKTADPTDDAAWTASAAEPALALHETMRTLSAGFGNGVSGITLFFWGVTMSYVFLAFHSEFFSGLDRKKVDPNDGA